MANAPGKGNGAGAGSGPPSQQQQQDPSSRKTYGKRGEDGYIGELGMTVGKLKLPYDLSLEVVEHWRLLQVHDPEATLGDALRELLRMAVASVPEDSILLAARDRGFTHVRRWAMIRDSAHHREMVADLERELTLEVLRGTPDRR